MTIGNADGGLLLDLTRFLDEAELEYLIDGKEEFAFPLRRKSGESDFYGRVEEELRRQNLLKIHSYRSVKEGYAKVSRPAALMFDLEALLRERPHLKFLRLEIQKLASAFPFINVPGFLRQHKHEALADIVLLRSSLEVLKYLIDHRSEVVGYLLREIPHGQSTKLIGKENLLLKLFASWRGEPSRWDDFFACFELVDKPAEFRIFAAECVCQGQKLRQFHGLLAKEWARDYEFPNLAGTLIVENLDTFHAISRRALESLIVWGGGWKAVHLRSLFGLFPVPIYYWGDIDKEGYEIFGHLKSIRPDLKPLLMDRATVEKYRSIHQKKDIFLGPFREVQELQGEYEYVSRNGIQIEQEQMRETWPYGTRLR